MCVLEFHFLFDERCEIFTLSQNKGNCDFCFPFAYLISCTFDSCIMLLTVMISPLREAERGSLSLAHAGSSPDVTLCGTSGMGSAQHLAFRLENSPTNLQWDNFLKGKYKHAARSPASKC